MKRAACRKNTFFAIEYLVKGVNAIFSILLNSVSFLIFWILSLRNDKRKRGKKALSARDDDWGKEKKAMMPSAVA